MTHLYTLDNGYYWTVIYQKCLLKENIKMLRSKVQETDGLIKQTNTHLLNINGLTYAVGEGAEGWNINLDKTNNELHKLTTLTALGLMIGDQPTEVKIVANYPLNLFNKETKIAFENHLKTKEFIEYQVNGEKKNIWIKDCLVFPQTLPVIYCNKVDTNIIGLLDIGGLTVQGAVTEDKNIIHSTKFTENLGMLILLHKMKKELNQKYCINLQDYQLEEVMKNGIGKDLFGSRVLINEICKSHVEEIIRIMKLVGWDIENLPILLTGGGGLVLYKYLKEWISNLRLSDDPLKDNVKGLWEVARVCYEA